jgi:hypothetical protein
MEEDANEASARDHRAVIGVTHEPRPIRAEIRATRMVEVGLMSSLPATSPASSRLLPGKMQHGLSI